ncbi:bone morphogenetic protein 10 [Denticeps clupeoides]|uniref:bone morphogenetic protein 10 n=1 Tax=Denticeps clupeoides TaxID=299321 RepID=UPI0010A3B622|nr:bone morphogenetic protein 10-like [Denticeps clupeoides]
MEKHAWKEDTGSREKLLFDTGWHAGGADTQSADTSPKLSAHGVVSSALPSALDHKIDKDKAVFHPATSTCEPKARDGEGPSEGGPIFTHEDLQGVGYMADPPASEKTEEVDLQKILGQFLTVLNLTDRETGSWPHSAWVEPPNYMLDLFNHFANDHSTVPSGNIVRSFTSEESSLLSGSRRGVTTHTLLFNVSIPHREHVVTAQLRLYVLIKHGHRYYNTMGHKVTVLEVQRGRGEAGGEKTIKEVLVNQQVIGGKSGWESFDLSSAVKRWRKSHYTAHLLEVHIQSVRSEGQVNGNVVDGESQADFEIDWSPEGKHSPVIIVFSDDQSKDLHEDKREHKDIYVHDATPRGGVRAGKKNVRDKEQDYDTSAPAHPKPTYDRTSRIRRSADSNYCRKISLYIEFKDIGWDTWIVAPSGYQANVCKGLCSIPLTKDVTPTKHAIVQTLFSLKSPQNVSPACCVPTKLDPISLLYKDDSGIITYKHKYEEMVVAECGCR